MKSTPKKTIHIVLDNGIERFVLKFGTDTPIHYYNVNTPYDLTLSYIDAYTAPRTVYAFDVYKDGNGGVIARDAFSSDAPHVRIPLAAFIGGAARLLDADGYELPTLDGLKSASNYHTEIRENLKRENAAKKSAYDITFNALIELITEKGLSL